MRILHVASEAAPLSQTGGLGQVAGALPAALASSEPDVEIALLTPLYRGAAQTLESLGATPEETGLGFEVVLCGYRFSAAIHRWRRAGVDWLLLDCPAAFDRPGIYGGPGGDYGDNPLRFALLCRCAAALAGDFDVVHCHDWQTGLVAPYLAALPERPGVAFTIHNLAYQGVFSKTLFEGLGLEWAMFNHHQIEFYDHINFLKAGAALADAITTVSPGYAAEIQTPEFGWGLDGFFAANADRLVGILNGIDTELWNPERDPAIAAPFSAARPRGKAACRAALADEVGLEVAPGELLVGAVTRLAEQKGPDLIAEVVPDLAPLGARLFLLGSGDPAMEHRLRTLGGWFSDHLRVEIGFDEALSHRVFAGCDAVLMPSRFEPCGLTQMIAMRYGALPVASAVGGLLDTVTDPGDEALAAGGGNGFLFYPTTAGGLRQALGRAARLHRDEAGWSRAVATAMRSDWSWERAAARYLELYRDIARRPGA